MESKRPKTAEELDLLPHPEGGWYRETWRSEIESHPEGYPGSRATATAIYFLLGAGDRSRWHTVRSTEIWLWHRGGPLRLDLGGAGELPDSRPSSVVLGPDLASGQQLQVIVPAGVWQQAEPLGDEEVLVSCVVSPGFSFDDFRLLPED